MKHCVLYIFVLLFTITLCNAQELRFEAGVGYTYKKFDIAFESQLRKPSFIKNELLVLLEAEVEYEIMNRLNFEVGYRFKTNIAEFYPESSIDYNNKHRFAFELSYSLPRFDNDIKLKNALRYQINLSESGKQNYYFRNEFELNYKITRILKPYIAPSIYYNINKRTFSEIRIELGNELEFGRNSMTIFYVIETYFSRADRTNYIVGVSYSIGF